LTETESDPNDSVLMLGTTPGSRPTKPMKLRLIEGSSVSSCWPMWPPISFEVVWTIGSSAVTLMVSAAPPTSSPTLNSCSSPTSSLMFSFTARLKLAASTVMR
jgi:hypothetical protein